MKILRIALAQINPAVGHLKSNTEKIVEYIEKAKGYGADIVVFPELAITGSPPEDLLLNKSFIKDNITCLNSIIPHTEGIVAVVGFVDSKDTGIGKAIYNAAAIIAGGGIVDNCHKVKLKGHGLFDESKYFMKGRGNLSYDIDGLSFSVATGNDMLNHEELIINIDASPYCRDSNIQKVKALCAKALKSRAYLAYVNMTGGQDEWVFEGGSAVVDKNGKIVAKSPLFEEDLLMADIELISNPLRSVRPSPGAGGEDLRKFMNIPLTLKATSMSQIDTNDDENNPPSPPFPRTESLRDRHKGGLGGFSGEKKKAIRGIVAKQLGPIEEVYSALVMGTRDYARKNGFQKVTLGLSGGIDSSLVAAVAKDALGQDNVTALFMPTRYTSKESKEDSYLVAKNMNIRLIEVPIDSLFEAYMTILKISLKKMPFRLTMENIQPRIRANILMAFSNNYGWLVLATGNKSEVASGYSTLYGDTAGGFAVIKDVPKTLVYKLSQWVNERAGKDVIPARIFTKAPSAELKHNQKDTDTLPPYELLDPILAAYVESNKTIDELISSGHNAELVKSIVEMVHKNEYKRRQSPIGPKITKRSFGKDWNFPISNKYR